MLTNRTDSTYAGQTNTALVSASVFHDAMAVVKRMSARLEVLPRTDGFALEPLGNEIKNERRRLMWAPAHLPVAWGTPINTDCSRDQLAGAVCTHACARLGQRKQNFADVQPRCGEG